MTENTDTNKLEELKVKIENTEKKPNEMGGFYFSSHFKISDPETGEVLVQARGD